MKKNLLIVGIAWSFVLAGWCMGDTPPATAPATTNPTTPRAIIEKVTADVLTVLRDPKLTKEEKAQKVRAIADEEIDFETLGRLSMSRYWRDLSDEQRKTFVAEFKKHISETHGHVLDEYVDEDVSVTGDRQEERNDWTVQTRIMGNKDGAKKEVARVDYRMRNKDGRWKIIDVTIDSVSMVANFRSQFQEIMPNGGFERVMKLLREKNVDRKK